MSAFEQHVMSLKQQHASQLGELQTVLNQQSLHIDSLSAEVQSLQKGSMHAQRSAVSAKEQTSILEKKLAAARAEVVASGSECTALHTKLHDCDSQLMAASSAAKHAADRDVNMQQQITALKHTIASSNNDHDIIGLQDRLQQAHNLIGSLQQQSKSGKTDCMLRINA